jgi:SOS-response transcriptional repressor LexA
MNRRQSYPERPARVLAFLQSYHAANGWMPSVEEIGEGCDISSKSIVVYHLAALEREGLIVRRHGRNQARCIRLVERAGAAGGER